MLQELMSQILRKLAKPLPLDLLTGLDRLMVSAKARRRRWAQSSHLPSIMALEDRILLSALSVTNALDDGSNGSLRWAVEQANSLVGADTITFDPMIFSTPQKITLTAGQLELTDVATTTITGPGADLLSISGNDASRVFLVNTGAMADLSGLTIMGGSDDHGGAVFNSGTVTMTNVRVSGNAALYGGGVDNIGTATLTNVLLTDNDSGYGGGIFNGDIVALTNVIITKNHAGVGAGIDNFGKATMVNVRLSQNLALGSGGGVYNHAIIEMTDVTLSENLASGAGYSGDGGAIFNEGKATLTNVTVSGNGTRFGSGGGIANNGEFAMFNVTVSSNSAGIKGGGIYSSGTVTMTNVRVSGNAALYGGGVDNIGTATLTNVLLTDNDSGYGGGIFNGDIVALTNVIITKNHAGVGAGIDNFGKATMVNVRLSQNLALGSGGGVYNHAIIEMTDVTLSENLASGAGYSGDGGAIFNEGKATLTNVTVSGNGTRFGSGGGIANNGEFAMFNVTVSSNSAGLKGGGIFNDGMVTMSNTLVAGNSNSSGASDILGPVSGTHNLIGTGGSGGLINGANGNIVGVVNPGLAPLGDYGGPTQTMALLPGSPAINTGTGGAGIPATDQRGLGRAGAVDIGAFESSVPLIVNTTSDGGGSDFGKLSLRQAINLANVLPSADTITFEPSVFATSQTIPLTAGQFELTDVATTTISGPGADLLSISGNYASRVFLVKPGAMADLSGLTIVDGHDDNGGGFLNSGTVTMTNVTVSGNFARYAGGGIFNSGTIKMTNVRVSGNDASAGGGICNVGTVTMADVWITGNRSYFDGGGIDNHGLLIITDSTVSGNGTPGHAHGWGGGIFNDGTAMLTNVTVSGNWLSAGGGICNRGSLTFTNGLLSGNTAMGYDLYWDGGNGGGISTNGSTTLTSVTVSGNSCHYGANKAGEGGGIRGNATLVNCTVSGNFVGGRHDPYYSGGGDGGGLCGTFLITNTIVAGNTNDSGASDILGLVLGTHNLIGTGGSGGLINGANGNIVGVVNPGLAPLGDYGGPTQTMALLPGSPAINTGTGGAGIPATDQRGLGRAGAVDIGAFESQGFTLTLVVGSSPQTAFVNQAFSHPLTVLVTANNSAEPVDGGIVSFSAIAPGNGASATLSANVAVISASHASVIATANGIVGVYVVSAAAKEAAPVVFRLNNITTVDASATSVGWGSQTHGVSGRTNDLPWANISRFVLMFSSPVTPATTDLTVTGRGGHIYVVKAVSVVGNTVMWTLTAPITTADIVTITVNPSLAVYTTQVRILPGDVNDDGVVNSQDQVLVRNAYLHIGPPTTIPLAFFDLNGDGVIDLTDYNLARKYNGTRLP